MRPAPRVEQKPGIYLLGGSAESAISAAKLGISFVFAYFINGEEEVLKEARRAFDAHLPPGSEAEFHLAPAVFAKTYKEEAEKHIVSRESIKVVLQDGRRVNVGTREQAEAYLENVSQPYEILVQKPG